MKIAVMGTGGVGGYFGGLLARAGNDVTFVARGPHLEAIKANGLRVESANDGNFTVPGNAVEDTSQAGPQELVLFAVKMYHNSAAIEAVKPMLGPHSLVLTLQNGIDNGQQLTHHAFRGALDALLVLAFAAFACVLIFGDCALHFVEVAGSLLLSIRQLRLKPGDGLFGRLVLLLSLSAVRYGACVGFSRL